MNALDTNILARYYISDPEDSEAERQRRVATWLFAEGSPCFVPRTVVLELEWVMRGVYKRPGADFAAALAHLLGIAHVAVEDRDQIEHALRLFKLGFDFADALHHAASHGCAAFLTFDSRTLVKRASRHALKPPVSLPPA